MIADLLNKYGSDKCSVHSYDSIYEPLFRLNRLAVKNVLEIGVLQGRSLMAWRAYFENAQIYGMDNAYYVTKIGFPNRIKILFCDAADENCIANAVQNLKFDIIIDDGCHYYDVQKTSFYALIKNSLVDGGLYIIEDVCNIEEVLEDSEFMRHFVIFDMRYQTNESNNVLMVYKHKQW